MRRYDDPVEVRRGQVGHGGHGVEAPEQFLWRGRLWKVRAVLAHWVETNPWWQSGGVRAVIGSDEAAAAGEPGESSEQRGGHAQVGDLVGERELWRVEAGRGARVGPGGEPDPGGVFDLSFDWSEGRWSLIGCTD